MKFVFFSVLENGENGLGDEGAEGALGAMPPRIFVLEPALDFDELEDAQRPGD